MTTFVECILKRIGGTIAEVGGVDYHFKPQEDGAHVAEIENDEHADRFLGITEGYRLYRKSKTKQRKEPTEPVNTQTTDSQDDPKNNEPEIK